MIVWSSPLFVHSLHMPSVAEVINMLPSCLQSIEETLVVPCIIELILWSGHTWGKLITSSEFSRFSSIFHRQAFSLSPPNARR